MLPGSGSSLPGRDSRCGGGQGASLERWSQPPQRDGAPSPAVGLRDARRRGYPSRCGGRTSSPYLRDPGRAQAPPPGPLIRHRRLRRPHTGPGTPASCVQGRQRGQGASRKSCRQPARQKWGARGKWETRSARRAHRPPEQHAALLGSSDRKGGASFSFGQNCENSHGPYL